jgi:hypothetical protein
MVVVVAGVSLDAVVVRQYGERDFGLRFVRSQLNLARVLDLALFSGQFLTVPECYTLRGLIAATLEASLQGMRWLAARRRGSFASLTPPKGAVEQ